MTGHSLDLDEIGKALALAQSEMPTIDLDGSGQVGTRTYGYATLANVINTVRPILAAHGLSFVQTPEPSGEGTLALTTTILHISGQYLSGTMVLPLTAATPQAYGSAMSYARRYSLSGVLGLASEDDLDGHEGPRRQRSGQQQQRSNPRPPPPAGQQRERLIKPDLTHQTQAATAEDWSLFWVKCRDMGMSSEQVREALKVTSVKNDIPYETLATILGWLETRKHADNADRVHLVPAQ